jgi:hypothetical protein
MSDENKVVPIKKPEKFNLERFRSTASPTIQGVEKLLTALPHHKISEARDFVRLQPEDKWSFELCFVNVPIKGVKKDTLHLIDENIAKTHLPSDTILRFRLALASKPYDVFFLCHVPSQNLDNPWNETNLAACTQAIDRWTLVTSRKEENVEGYGVKFSQDYDAFPQPKWPTQDVYELIEVTWAGRMIETNDDPALARLTGRKPSVT